MLRQRIPYARILLQLGPRAPGLNKSNLSRWKKSGYLLWLAEQERREDAQAQVQSLLDTLGQNDTTKVHQATQHLAAMRIIQVVAGFNPGALAQAFEKEPQTFVRLIQTLPKLSRGGTECERLLLELAERKASLNGEHEPEKRVVSQRTLQYIAQKMKLL